MNKRDREALRLESIKTLTEKNEFIEEKLRTHALSTNSSLIEIEIPVGWSEIVCRLHESLQEIKPDYQILQVKEKFGKLCYYVGPVDSPLEAEAMKMLVSIAERTSTEVCQICGEPGTLRSESIFVGTLCDRDAEFMSKAQA